MASAKDIRFDQRNVTNTAYVETYVNGNSLIIRTDNTGSVIGVTTLEGTPIGTTNPSTGNFTNFTASNISSSNSLSASSAFFSLNVLINGVLSVFNKIYAYAGIIGDITGSLSGSNVVTNTITSSFITSSNIISFNITSSNVSSSTLISNNITSSNISASNYVSASNVYVENTITSDTGSFIYFNLNNTGSAPNSYGDPGMPGEVRFDNNFIYIYTNNVWVRTPIVRWST